MKLRNKFLSVSLLCIYLLVGTAEGADSVKFNPQWKTGEEAEYLSHALITLNIAEYPELSGTILDIQMKTTFQILDTTKKSTSFRKSNSDTIITSPFAASLPPTLRAYSYSAQNTLDELSELSDTLQLEYDLNQKGYLIRNNNVDQQKQWIEDYFNFLMQTSLVTTSTSDLLQQFPSLIKEIPTHPIKVYDVHPTDFFKKSFRTGEKISTPLKIPLPKESGKKDLTLEIPGELLALKDGSSNQIITTYSLTNDDAADLIMDLINRENPKEAQQFQESWKRLKTLGVRLNSDLEITNKFYFQDGSNWPDHLTTYCEWTFILILKPLKTAGPSDFQTLPDSLHGKLILNIQETKIPK